MIEVDVIEASHSTLFELADELTSAATRVSAVSELPLPKSSCRTRCTCERLRGVATWPATPAGTFRGVVSSVGALGCGCRQSLLLWMSARTWEAQFALASVTLSNRHGLSRVEIIRRLNSY